MQSAAVDFKYELGTCLHEGDRQAEYETLYDGHPAVVRFIRPETSLEQAKLLSEFAWAARQTPGEEPHVVDYGEANIFDTDVVFAVTARSPEPPSGGPTPLYRRHAKLAIGGVIGAGALCLLLLRNAEHKAPPQAPPPVAVHRAEVPAPAAEIKPPAPKPRPVHRKPRHKRK